MALKSTDIPKGSGPSHVSTYAHSYVHFPRVSLWPLSSVRLPYPCCTSTYPVCPSLPPVPTHASRVPVLHKQNHVNLVTQKFKLE